MGILVDTTNTPAVLDWNAGTGNGTTAAFSPVAGSLVVVIVEVDANTQGGSSTTVADSLGNAYSLLIRGNTGSCNEIWYRYYASAPGSITVTATPTDGWTATATGKLTTQVLTGANATQTGATASAVNANTVSLTPTKIGSFIAVSYTSYSTSVTCTAAANTTLLSNTNGGTQGFTNTSLKGTSLTTATTATAYGVSNGTGTRDIIAAEIIPDAGSTPATVTPPAGSVSFTATPPSVGGSKVVVPPAGVTNFSATAPVVTGGASATVVAPAGSLSFTGPSGAVVAPATVEAPPGSVSWTASSPSITASNSTVVVAPAGVTTFSATAPAVNSGRLTVAPAGSTSYTAVAPVINTGYTVSAPAGTTSWTAVGPAVSGSMGAVVQPPAGSVSFGAVGPAILAGRVVVAPAGSTSFTAVAPTIVTPPPGTIGVPAGSVSFTATAAVVKGAATIVSPAGTYQLRATAPAVTIATLQYRFRPPSRTQLRYRADRFWRRVTDEVSRSVLKQGPGVYVLVDNPSNEDIAASQAAYLGGRDYVVDDTEAQALIAAGYGAYVIPIL